MADRGRAYGEACVRCREKKRRCRPGKIEGVCQICERDQAVCAVFSKRPSASSLSRVSPSRLSTTVQSSMVRPSEIRISDTVIDTVTFEQHIASQDSTEEVFPALTESWISPDLSATHPSSHLVGPSNPQLATNRIGPSQQSLGPSMSDLTDQEVYLRTYFSWQCPQHMPVDEQLFRRDMQAIPRGRYYSDLLLFAIQAQASRHIVTAATGMSFADKANAAIMASLSQVPTVPTIQALLILSGRDLALGHISAGWLKSGMAFRMIDDLGIRGDMERPTVNETMDEDRLMRGRLFWSAYNGIMPSQTWWTPYLSDDNPIIFVPQRNYDGETFFASCLLYQEIERIIDHLYQSRRIPHSSEDQLFINDQHARLTGWRSRIDSRVLLDTAYLPTVCPPPHILTVNILYRVAWILLYRPFKNKPILPSSNETAASICIARSTEINLLFNLHERTYDLRNITYLLAYMAYVTATIDVAEALSTNPVRSVPARKRLELTLRVLTKASQHTPGIQRSIHQLRRELVPHATSHMTGFSRGTTPTTAHPAAADHDPETTSISSPVEAVVNPLNETFSLELGFEELFASLLPEQSAPNPTTWNNDIFSSDVDATLPSMDLDWLWS